jgi:hypothetical protein
VNDGVPAIENLGQEAIVDAANGTQERTEKLVSVYVEGGGCRTLASGEGAFVKNRGRGRCSRAYCVWHQDTPTWPTLPGP